MNTTLATTHPSAALRTPTDLGSDATRDIAAALTGLLADMFALYLKTKNFHWHMSGPHFRDYHLLLDEQGDQIFATTDAIAERARKVGGTTLRSIGHIHRLQRLADNDAEFVTAEDMLAELADDNKRLTTFLREVHDVCEEHNDVATASLIEVWIDEAERRVWFLYESNSQALRRRPEPVCLIPASFAADLVERMGRTRLRRLSVARRPRPASQPDPPKRSAGGSCFGPQRERDCVQASRE